MVDSINTNRISGLASGMDTESMVNDLMRAERMPLDKLEQDKTWMTWQRDAYRDVNKLFYDLDQQVLDMKLQKTYSSKSTSTTQSGAVTASATAASTNGTYNIQVDQLATSAVNFSQSAISGGDEPINLDGKLNEQVFANGSIDTGADTELSFDFFTYDKNGNRQDHQVKFTGDDSMNDIFKKISTASDGAVRAFYDNEADKVILERTETGNFNQSDEFLGAEIGFNGQTNSSFLTDILQIKNGKQVTLEDGTTEWQRAETGGSNARFIYNNGYEVETTKNSYTLDGVTFNFTDTTDGPAKVTVNNDVDAALEKIVGFVDKYNELLEKVNESVSEPRYRDYKPLTDAQKEEMSDKQIEQWEERAKSGLLRGDNMLSSGLVSMRQSWYGQIDNESSFSHLSNIGIETSPNYMDGGKLIVDEEDLRTALREDPQSVYKLFSNDVEGSGRGIINRLEDSMAGTMDRIQERAGKGTQTLEQYTLGKQLKDIDTRIDRFQDKLVQTENRYWRQFTEMEKAIQRMNQQSMYLMNQFGG
ncbi:flagellar hook-associated protein 2 [Sediminibacillus massiliensis]|uniref:flagellar hook-associated protein 2 n=1 Tax=Sediminibacillus massiliensis TaxID=1926277 RepID=UPI0009887C21|nr:flagellar hook-associated protein 2 [Sediminibacillus massiliensis]